MKSLVTISVRSTVYAQLETLAASDGLTIGQLVERLPLPSAEQCAVIRSTRPQCQSSRWHRSISNEATAVGFAAWQDEPDLPMTIEVSDECARGVERIAKRAGCSTIEAADRVIGMFLDRQVVS